MAQSLLVKKAEITPELVSRLVAAQFPQWADLPLRPVDADGWDNATFRLGRHMSVQLPSSQAYVEQIDKEQRWLPVLARQLPLPIPEPLAQGEPGGGFPGAHNFFRGGSPAYYDAETRAALTALHDHIDTGLATVVWEADPWPWLGDLEGDDRSRLRAGY